MGDQLRQLFKTLAIAAAVVALPLVSAHADNDWHRHGYWGGGDGDSQGEDWQGGEYGGYGGNLYFYGGGPSYYYAQPPAYYYPPPPAYYYPPPQPYYPSEPDD